MHVSSIIMRSKYPTSYLHFERTLQKISKFKGIGEEGNSFCENETKQHVPFF